MTPSYLDQINAYLLAGKPLGGPGTGPIYQPQETKGLDQTVRPLSVLAPSRGRVWPSARKVMARMSGPTPWSRGLANVGVGLYNEGGLSPG
jgi:hypothetical protein